MTSSNPYLNVLRSLEGELFPVVAVERSSGTFRFEPPSGVRTARGLSGLTIIFVAGVSALCFVRRRTGVSLSTHASASTGLLSPRNLFLVFTFLNSAFQLLYLAHLPDPHHTINLVSACLRNFLLLAEALALALVLTHGLASRINSLEGYSVRPDLRWFSGKRFKLAACLGAAVLLSAELAASIENLAASLALRESFFDARMKLLLLATSPTASTGATTTTILRVLAGPIEILQRDLQRMRRSEIAKDTVQVAAQIAIILVVVLFLSNVSSRLPRVTEPLRALPTRIRFKRASSVSKLPVAVAVVSGDPEEVPSVEVVEADQDTTGLGYIRANVLALAALAGAVFLSTLVSNYILVLDVLGRRWTTPVQSFGPTRLWSTYVLTSVSLATLVALAYYQLVPQRTSSSSPAPSTSWSCSKFSSFARRYLAQRRRQRSHTDMTTTTTTANNVSRVGAEPLVLFRQDCSAIELGYVAALPGPARSINSSISTSSTTESSDASSDEGKMFGP